MEGDGIKNRAGECEDVLGFYHGVSLPALLCALHFESNGSVPRPRATSGGVRVCVLLDMKGGFESVYVGGRPGLLCEAPCLCACPRPVTLRQ